MCTCALLSMFLYFYTFNIALIKILYVFLQHINYWIYYFRNINLQRFLITILKYHFEVNYNKKFYGICTYNVF